MADGSAPTRWAKSSHSQELSNCVEVSFDDRVLVRDSKDPQPMLIFDRDAWRRFVTWRCS